MRRPIPVQTLVVPRGDGTFQAQAIKQGGQSETCDHLHRHQDTAWSCAQRIRRSMQAGTAEVPHDLAMSAAIDAGTRRMRERGGKIWTVGDFNEACRTYERIRPEGTT